MAIKILALTNRFSALYYVVWLMNAQIRHLVYTSYMYVRSNHATTVNTVVTECMCTINNIHMHM